MRMSSIVLLLSLLTGGCANFQAVSQFAKDTGDLTRTVRDELSQLDELCMRQAEVVIVATGITDEGPLKSCRRHKAAQGRLAKVTVAVLEDYAKALDGLANDRAFDVSKEVQGVGREVAGLRDADGKALLGARELSAVTKLAELLVNLAASREREAAVKRLAAEKDDLAVLGGLLRSFFVAPPGRGQAPYANLVSLTASELDSTQALLRGPAMRNAEPIRSFELVRELETRRGLIGRRADPGPEGVAQQTAGAIDLWLAALDRFGDEALSRDPKLLYERLKALRAKTDELRAALRVLGT